MSKSQPTGSLLQFPVPKSLQTKTVEHTAGSKTYIGIRELAVLSGLSASGIYDLIKHNPSFPFKNVGLKKKYVVDLEAFEKWRDERTKVEKAKTFQIPTATELMTRYKK